MKKIIFLLLLPCYVWAQTTSTDLSSYGIKASIATSSDLPVERIEQKESYLKTPEINIQLTNGEDITITQLKKPLTIALTKSEFAKVLKQKRKDISLKALVNTGNDMLIERSYKDDGRKIYKFMLLRVIKGKEYMIEGSEVSDEALCRKIMEMAKTCK
jgi:hypothetical protein